VKRKLLVIDTETGGLDPARHSILSIAALVYQDGVVVDEYYSLVAEPEIVAEESALKINGLTVEQVRSEGTSAPNAADAIEAMLQKHDMRDRVTIAGHNAAFDRAFLLRLWRLAGRDGDKRFSHRVLCVQTGALLLEQAGRVVLPGGSASLDSLCAMWGIPLDRASGHHALTDARAHAAVLRRLIREVSASIHIDTAFGRH
jgi:DNA polymerase-3 subunit epsilon